MTTASRQVRERVVFHGKVQGVGFRQRTRSLARRFPVVGYVKNLADGTVELVVQGPRTGVGGLIEAIETDFEGMISDRLREVVASGEELTDFDIRF